MFPTKPLPPVTTVRCATVTRRLKSNRINSKLDGSASAYLASQSSSLPAQPTGWMSGVSSVSVTSFPPTTGWIAGTGFVGDDHGRDPLAVGEISSPPETPGSDSGVAAELPRSIE